MKTNECVPEFVNLKARKRGIIYHEYQIRVIEGAMGKGRKSIPSRIHALQGGSAKTHRKMNDQEPRPPEKMPPCPKHLDKEARVEWDRAGKLLMAVGLMTELDMATLAGYCDAYSAWARATIEVSITGPVLIRPEDIPLLNPWLRVAREAFDRMMKNAVLLGLSPSSRAGLKVEKPKVLDKADKFLLECKD